MRQTAKFHNRVYKTDGTNRIVEVGDTVSLKLKDGSYDDATLTGVNEGGFEIEWDHTEANIRKEDVDGVHPDHLWSCEYYGGSVVPGTPPPVEWD